MEAKAANLLTFLQAPKQFIIPLYQRTYSWTRKECRQLWDDIQQVAEDNRIPAHFIGSIVYIEKGIYQVSSIPQLLVIDGQQRITTISLLLAALAERIKNIDEEFDTSPKRIMNYYLTNQNEDEALYYKLILTRSDKEALFNVINNMDVPEQSAHRIYDNYRFFEKLIQETEIDLDKIFEGISKLLIVDVTLDRTYDNPQLIFESLNSTGLDLTQADLIRNFILMGLEPKTQNWLYTQYWHRMEEDFGQNEYTNLFDEFMRNYLTIKSEAGKIPPFRDIYLRFKEHVRYLRDDADIEDVVADIRLYSSYYVRLAFPERHVDDLEIRRVMEDINTLKVDVAYPFLMEVYDDFEQHQRLTREEFIEILKIVESYVFRRAICGIPTNSLNKTFATLKRSVNKDGYLSSVKAAFLQMDAYRRFPRDEEFWDEFIRKDVYNFARRNYLLSKLENHNRKEYVNIPEYTVEHIMPQNPNLSEQWRNMLGDDWEKIQATWLHTIGNLTLTGYNPELSDKPFIEKRDMIGGFADSPIRLNHSLRHLDSWGERQINDRAVEIATLALEVWAIPHLSQREAEEYEQWLLAKDLDALTQITLENYEYLHGEIMEIFQILRKEILKLDVGIREEYKKKYIAYKTTTNFVDIVPQASRLRLSLNLRFDEINDPKGICVDVSNVGRWGNGDVEVGVASIEEIEYAMYLISQSYQMHSDELEI